MAGFQKGGHSGPLGPDDEVYFLDSSKLRVGDIILTASPSTTESGVIRAATGGNFSHAILILDAPDAMESANAGVVKIRLDRFCVRSTENILVRRPKPDYPFDAEKLIKSAEALMGVPYASLNAITSIVALIPVAERGDFFCSQLVAHCFLEAGFDTGLRPAKTTPAHLERSPRLDDLSRQEILIKRVIKSVGFAPDFLDGSNEETPNETINLRSQRAVSGMKPVFEAHGIKVASREQAIMAVQRALRERAPYAAELDQAVATVYRAIDIPSIARNFLPPDDESNFQDLIIARAILSGRLTKEDAENQVAFYRERLIIKEAAIAEKREHVIAQRSAYFTTGAECTRLHLAAEAEVLAIQQKIFEVMSRSLQVLEVFVEHDGEPILLEPTFVALILPGLRELLAKYGFRSS